MWLQLGQRIIPCFTKLGLTWQRFCCEKWLDASLFVFENADLECLFLGATTWDNYRRTRVKL